MSLLKPRDIANVQFRSAWRGYNEADVDEFVEKIVSAYETLYHKYQELQEHTGTLQHRLDEYSQTEGQIDETLAFAKQVAKDAKEAAEHQAEAILAKARLDAEDMLRQARRKVDEYASRALEVARQEAAFRGRLSELLDAYKALLEQGRDGARELSRAVAELADEAAVGMDGDDFGHVDAAFEVALDDEPESESVDVDGDWDPTLADDIDLEPTRRMDAVRERRTEA